MCKLKLFILAFILYVGHGAFANPPEGTLKWSDDFTYNGLPDSTKWRYETGCSIRNKESQFYTYRDIDNAFCTDGFLTIRALKESMGTCSVTSASLISLGTFEFLYGKIDIRAKLPKGNGTWAALWLMADYRYGDWPLNGEVDIVESVGHDTNRVHFNIHTKDYNHAIGTNKGANLRIPDLYADFHVYTVEWYPTKLIFKVDGNESFEFKKESNNQAKWPFYNPMYILMNLAIGGTWGGLKGVSEAIFPSDLIIDYVRVYALNK